VRALLFVAALAACLGCYVGGFCSGYQHGRYGDQAWQMMATDGNTVVCIGSQASLPYEWRYTSASGGVFKVYRDREDAAACVRRLQKLLNDFDPPKNEQNGGQP
jgi:hypothetical protein